jgi:formate/nitrite transporter FocA (FNT family)
MVGVQLARVKEEGALLIAFSFPISLPMILKNMLLFTESMVVVMLGKCFRYL